MYESSFFFSFFLAWMRKSKRKEEREKEGKGEDLPYYYDDDVFLREIYDRKGTRQRKKCADGLSEFDFTFFFPPRDT